MALELDDGVRLADAGALVTHGVLCSEPSLSVEERSRLSLGTFFALQERLVLFLVCLRDEDVGVRGVAARLAEEDDGTVASSSSFSSSSFSSFSGMPLRIGATVRTGWRRMCSEGAGGEGSEKQAAQQRERAARGEHVVHGAGFDRRAK